MTTMTAGVRVSGGRERGRLLALGWVTWRQHRAALAGITVAALALAITMIVSGLRIHHAFAPFVTSDCAGTGWHAQACGSVADSIADYKEAGVPIALHVLPIVIAVFLGAPVIAREAEAGTTQFAWTQQVSRTRWLLTRLVLLGGFVIVVCAALGALAGWWLHPFEAVGDSSRWQGGDFDVTSLLLAAWGLLGFAAGVLAGALARRVVPAIAAAGVATGVVVMAFAWKLDYWVFSLAPLTTRSVPWTAEYNVGSGPATSLINTWPPTSWAGTARGGWLVRGWFTGPGGHPLGNAAAEHVINALYGTNGAQPNPVRWLATHHDAFVVTYQSAARFWPFQLSLAAVLVVAAALACLAAARLIHRPA